MADSSPSPPSSRVILSVGDLAGGLKELVETHFDDVWVEGELSNFRQYRSGHSYFTLKDEEAQLRCVMWRHFAQYVFFEPKDGMLVRVHGHASVYEPRGELQLVTRSMQLAGEGALQKAFDELKQKLREEGLFEPQHKQPLPPYPETIGVITSGDGAALHDILSILKRRFPQVRVLVCPVRVQGLGAAEEIAEAIDTFNLLDPGEAFHPDVLIVGRGGGSAEDLWAFNEERVARAIFACHIPIVSAVGHQTDYAISDFVADVRAATPSMAAELVVPDRRDVSALIRGYHAVLHDQVVDKTRAYRQRIETLTRSYSFYKPVEHLHRQRRHLDALLGRLERAAQHRSEGARQRLATLLHRLKALDPTRPLRRGYARIVRNGLPVSQAADLYPEDLITLQFHDGDRKAKIES